MTAADYRERADAYAAIIAEWQQQRDAHYREGDAINHDIEELRTYQAAIVALASLTEGQQRYKESRRRARNRELQPQA